VVGTGELGVCPHCGRPLQVPDELEALRALADELGIVVDLDGNGRRQVARSGKAAFYLEAGRLHWLNEGAPAEG
jgi:hypothetical protein